MILVVREMGIKYITFSSVWREEIGGLEVFFHAFLCTLEESGRVSK